MSTQATPVLRQVDERGSDGLSVELLWEKDSGQLFVRVTDTRINWTRQFAVTKDQSADAFQHPFAYIGLDDER